MLHGDRDTLDWIIDWGSYWTELLPDLTSPSLTAERYERLKSLAGPGRNELVELLKKNLSNEDVQRAMARLDEVLEKVDTGDIEIVPAGATGTA